MGPWLLTKIVLEYISGSKFKNILFIYYSSLDSEWKLQPPLRSIFKKELSKDLAVQEEVRTKQWELHFSEYGRGVSMYRTSDMLKLILQGCPDSMRRELWLSFSG